MISKEQLPERLYSLSDNALYPFSFDLLANWFMVYECLEAAQAEYEFPARSWRTELWTDAAEPSRKLYSRDCIFLVAEFDETWRN